MMSHLCRSQPRRNAKRAAGLLAALITPLAALAVQAPPIPDYNNDAGVDVLDLAKFQTLYTDPNNASQQFFGLFDADGSEILDVADVSALQNALTPPMAVLSVGVRNGDFEGGVACDAPIYWFSQGDVSVELDGSQSNHVALLDESYNQAGGHSRIWQRFDNPDLHYLSFDLAFFSSGLAPDETTQGVPPDSFSAFLFEPVAVGPSIPVGVDTPRSPQHTSAFLYIDSDGELAYDPNRVQFFDVAAGDRIRDDEITAARFKQVNSPVKVVFDFRPTDGVVPERLHLEFGFANGLNTADSFVQLDNVDLGCPPGYCCQEGASGGIVRVIDDGDACTQDLCDPNTGKVSHESIFGPNEPELAACCEYCIKEFDASIVVMLDYSSSTELGDWQNALDATVTLLDTFSTIPSGLARPEIAIGQFYGGAGGPNSPDAVIASPILPVYFDDGTSDYDILRTWITQHYTTSPGGSTSISDALKVSRWHLVNNAAPSQDKYIILMTDGWTRVPAGQPDCWNPPAENCVCVPARDAANDEAASAKSDGISIYVSYYLGQAETQCANIDNALDPNHIAAVMAREWLKYEIASTPSHFFPHPDSSGAGPFDCVFLDIGNRISCDDGDPTTVDYCDNGVCLHD